MRPTSAAEPSAELAPRAPAGVEAEAAPGEAGRLAGPALVAGFAVLTGVLAVRSLHWPLVHDAPIMHYLAQRLAEGAVPYRDFFDMNFPGTYLLHLAVVTTLGPGDAAWRAFDLAWLALTALAVAALAAPWGAVAAAGGALVFAAYHLAGGAWQAGQRDFLLCVFLLGGALGVARWLERRRGTAPLWWAGLALGAGATVKPHALALAGALALTVALTARRAGLGPGAPLAAFAAGVSAAPLGVLAWLAAKGALAAWRAIVFDYLLPLYAPLGRPRTWAFHRWHVWIPLGAAVAAGLIATLSARRRPAAGPRLLVAVLGLGYGLAHYVAQGKGWEYHLYPLAAFAAVLAFAAVGRPHPARPGTAVVGATALAAVLLLLGSKGGEAGEARWIRDKHDRVAAVARDLAPLLARGGPVQVLDTAEGGVHALLRLGARQATRFVYDFHFFHHVDHPVIQALRAEFLAAWDARPPRAVVVFERGWPAGGYERLERFPALAERLRRDYRIVARGDGYRVYAQRDDS